MNILNIFKKGVLVIGSANYGKQVSVIRDNIERISYLLNYDLLATYHLFPKENQHKIDRFFNVHRPHEVMKLYLKWIEEYVTKTNENPFELDHNYKVVRVSSQEFRNDLWSNITNS